MGLQQNIQQFFADGFEIVRMIPSALSEKPGAWDWSIAKFEAQDRLKPPPPGAIVFTSSSSITFWKTLERDMVPLAVINRGFGGSKIHQVAHYVDRIVIPYHPRAVVLFAGWFWGGRGAEKVAPSGSRAKGSAKHVMWRLLIGLALFLAAALLGTMGAR